MAGTTNEVTNTNYVRKVLTDADLAAFAPDDTNGRVDVDIPDQTWLNIMAGDNWAKLVVGYDNDTTGGNDTNIVPLTCHDFPITTDGSDIVAQIHTAGPTSSTTAPAGLSGSTPGSGCTAGTGARSRSTRTGGSFYAALTTGDGTLATGQAAYALHHAVRAARDAYPTTPSLWAAHIHTGA